MLGLYTKTPSERKRYSIDYYDWLDLNEKIFSMTFTPEPIEELEVDAYSIDANGSRVVFFVAGGVDGVRYVVNIRMTTTGGQLKEDEVMFEVEEIFEPIVITL